MSQDSSFHTIEAVKKSISEYQKNGLSINVASKAWIVREDQQYVVDMINKSLNIFDSGIRFIKALTLQDKALFNTWMKSSDKVLIISMNMKGNEVLVWCKLYNDYEFGKNFCWDCRKWNARLNCDHCGIANYCNEKCRSKSETKGHKACPSIKNMKGM